MWTKNSDSGRWYKKEDVLEKDKFDSLKQDIEKVRLYSKCLSGSTFVPMNDLNNIYDVLQTRDQYNWFIGKPGSTFSISATPSFYKSIDSNNKEEFYQKFSFEYGLTLKNKFTPVKLINDCIDNFTEVDVATTEQLEGIGTYQPGLIIDGVILKDGHRILVKNQKDTINLSSSIDPDIYFNHSYQIEQDNITSIEYSYFNSDNGVYKYTNSTLVRDLDLATYSDAYRYSVSVKLGDNQTQNQYHLKRLKNGYYPLYVNGESMEFSQTNNWILRNQVDYNNIYEISYNDIVRYATQSYQEDQFTYVIPQRVISVGEFGMIAVLQDGYTNIIDDKYKVNFNAIAETEKYYWICGNEGTLIKVFKLDMSISRVELNEFADLTSIDFVDNLRGFLVGKFNTIYFTNDSGNTWNKISKSELESCSYNKVIYSSINQAFIGGETGVFIQLDYISNDWILYKRKISKYLNTEEPTEEYLLVDDINDMFLMSYSSSNTWGLTYATATSSMIAVNKEVLFIASNGGNLVVHDINNFDPNFDFIYLSFTSSQTDINSIVAISGSSSIYFASNDVYKIDINNFNLITGTSNNIFSTYSSTKAYSKYINKLFDFRAENLYLCGNNSTLLYSGFTSSLFEIDSNFANRYKSKLLFLDYDIGSKLNFFDDDQNYRLPNSLTFSADNIGTSIEVTNITGEYNWLNYYKDREKTFTYHTSMDVANEVLFSTVFTEAPTTYFTITSAEINTDPSVIEILAPNIDITGSSRYIASTFSISGVSNPEILYIHKYLMVIKKTLFYTCDVGDVMYMESDVIRATYVINYINIVGFDKYLYCFVDFNEGVVNDLKAYSGKISFINLNKFTEVTPPSGNNIGYTQSEFTWNYDNNINPDDYFSFAPLQSFGASGSLLLHFNLHPVSYGYKLSYDDNGIYTLSTKYNNKTAYYNMQSKVIIDSGTFSMVYTDAFIKFGYEPTYNILDYLNMVDSSRFVSSKRFLAMPRYVSLPGNATGTFTPNNIYIDTNANSYLSGFPGNKILFGEKFEFEFNSIWINTFVDVILYTSSTSYLSERMLVMKKYYDDQLGGWVMEFNKRLSYINGDSIVAIDILSRNRLDQISADLQLMNNIQRDTLGGGKSMEIPANSGNFFYNLESELNSKVYTDSYAKILLADKDIKDSLSAIIFIDDRDELAMSTIKLEENFDIPIERTSRYTVGLKDYLLISCSQSFNLSVGDPVVLSFNGPSFSSNYLNRNYFGYQTVQGIVGTNSFYTFKTFDGVDIPFVDPGVLSYYTKDPFLNYQPVDIMDLGVDKEPKRAVEILPDNVLVDGSRYLLTDLDLTKYRYQLVDGLSVVDIYNKYPWILEGEISDAIIGEDTNGVVWYMGDWKCGRWFGGTWMSGRWISGDWYQGIWNSFNTVYKQLGVEVNRKLSNSQSSKWYDGRWFDGTWNNGTWFNGRRYAGDWNDGIWYNGIWNDGTWNNGQFTGGVWVLGKWYGGLFNCDNKPSYWIDGEWYGGDFENGMWYNGQFSENNGKTSRFGTKAFNTRTAIWQAGKFIGGEFHSYLNIDSETGETIASEFNKYSIWNTGILSGGSWYGGVAYAINFNSGTWYNGIIEEIQITGFEVTQGQLSKFKLNGLFQFNVSDDIWIVTNGNPTPYSIFGNYEVPGNYKVLLTEEVGETTVITINKDLYPITGATSISGIETGLRATSNFKNSTWKSGVWTNGIFDGGYFEGGIWYGGKFTANWGK
jgi:hypothetical protein